MLSVVGLVLLAALCHAIWNAYVKVSEDRLAGLVSINLIGAASGLLMIPFVPVPDTTGWMLIGLSVPVHIFYKLLLAKAYGRGDLTLVYPVVRGVAPLAVWMIALLALRERLTPIELGGMVSICAGIVTMAAERAHLVHLAFRPLAIAILTGLTIACYTVIDGLGSRHGPTPFSFAAWLFVLDGGLFALLAWYRRGSKLWTTVRLGWRAGLASGVVAVGSYGVFLWALSRGAMGTIAALRETSVLFAALIGVLFLGERVSPPRYAAMLLITLGIVLLARTA
jgi:drug/metabolite transporter (DMT)-like permease